MTYNFNQQLTRSKPHEAVLDKYLEGYFFIRLANMTEERQGIDRIMRLRNPFLSDSHYETEGLLVPFFVLNNLFTRFSFPH